VISGAASKEIPAPAGSVTMKVTEIALKNAWRISAPSR